MKKLKLTNLAKNEIEKKDLKDIKGGNEAIFCGCKSCCGGERGIKVKTRRAFRG